MIATRAMDPLKLVIWAGMERVIKSGQMAALVELARAIGDSLPGVDLEEKLAAFELGSTNRERFSHPNLPGTFVRLRRDIFGEADCCTLPWSRQTHDLMRRYNEGMPRGGGAAHPLMIVQHEVHRRLGEVVDLASRNSITGDVEIAHRGLQRLRLAEDEVRQLLGEGAVLYWIGQ